MSITRACTTHVSTLEDAACVVEDVPRARIFPGFLPCLLSTFPVFGPFVVTEVAPWDGWEEMVPAGGGDGMRVFLERQRRIVGYFWRRVFSQLVGQ
jgi:hypothetical protein